MTWQYNLKGKVDTSVNVDVFDIDAIDNTKETIAALKAKGKFVICYINVGSYEPWRKDASKFPKSIIGKKMQGWEEYWFDIRRIDLLEPIFRSRFEMAKDKQCDAIEADNVDAVRFIVCCLLFLLTVFCCSLLFNTSSFVTQTFVSLKISTPMTVASS